MLKCPSLQPAHFITAKLIIMKNVFLFVLLAMLGTACKKEAANNPVQPAANNSIENATLAGSGNIIFADEGDQGSSAKIYVRKDGRYVLALENMDYATTFDLNVYLSQTGEVTTYSIKLFSAKNFSGNIYVALPSNFNMAAFKHLIIQNDTQAKPAASATFN